MVYYESKGIYYSNYYTQSSMISSEHFIYIGIVQYLAYTCNTATNSI